MSVIADYANLYETVLSVWVALFLVRPGLALAIWREKA
jgi:hypothetical protein